jgi:hypothetical protein
MTTATAAVRTHQGSCHCGTVRFEAELDLSTGSRCNCSICTKIPTVNAITRPDGLRITAGESELATYAWGGRTATRYFCRRCGTHCFLRGDLPELGGAYASVSVSALDDVDPNLLTLVHWDGRHDNWGAGPRATPWLIFAA